ncbi:MAG TPA: pitrilysin family protein [Planctomycetota bacterium]|nr:pitrilysin family protein [Planctomycetota bacterium]
MKERARTLPAPVREARLKNGLQVLLCRRKGHPVVACMVWYRVGSRDERPGETGIAHFLEHLTFKGTRRFGKGVIDAITARLGGYDNAFTDHDATAYVFQFASDRWGAALEIEADRMRGCRFDGREFEAERRVVLEEMRMSLDDPWRDLYHETAAVVFLAHPYRQPVIGWEGDLRRVSREAVAAFYRSRYRPDNATVVLVGDLDPRGALARVRRAFGGIRVPASEQPPASPTPSEPPARGERRLVLERPDAVARLLVAYRTCRVGESDDVALDALGAILAAGRSSRFYRRLVLGQRVATAVGAENDTRADPGVFWVSLEVRPGVPPPRAERALLAEVARIAREGPDRKEIARAKRALLAACRFQWESAGDLAEELGRYASQTAWRAIHRYVPDVLRLDRGTVRKVAARYFQPGNRVVGVARRARRPLPARGGAGPPLPPEGRGREVQRRGPVVPRRLLPRRGFLPVVRLADRRFVLANGLVLLVSRNAAAPTATVGAFVEAGLACETGRPSGLAHLAGALLEEGTRGRSGREITETVESVGGFLEAGLGGTSLSVPAEHLPLGLDLLADLLARPTYPEPAFRRRRDLLLAELRGEEDDPRARAHQRLREAVYGRHPLRRPTKGTPASVARIARSDLVEFHRRWFAPQRTIVAVSGEVEAGEVLDRARRTLGAWTADPSPLPRPRRPSIQRRGREILIPEARAQVQAVLGHLGVTRDDPDFYALLLLDQVLGGGAGFTDRLSRRLREELGLAYAVHADLTSTAGKEPGLFVATVGTAGESFRAAVEGIRREFRRVLREPPSASELRTAKDYLLGSYVFGLERNAGRALHLLQRERFGLGEDFLRRYVERIERTSTGEVASAARRHVRPEALTLVAIGPLERRARRA